MALRIAANIAKRSAQCKHFSQLTSQYKSQIIPPAYTSLFHTTASPFASAASKVDQAFEKILHLDIIEVHLLTELVNEKMGIKPLTPAQRAAMAGGGGAAAAPAEAKVEKTTFDLKLTGFDGKSKIKVIKEIRTITGLGLKEAKELVEGAPRTVKTEIKMEEAEQLKAKLEAVGGTVEIS
jgi:large subunit ribosomal protein L7/L12